MVFWSPPALALDLTLVSADTRLRGLGIVKNAGKPVSLTALLCWACKRIRLLC